MISLYHRKTNRRHVFVAVQPVVSVQEEPLVESVREAEPLVECVHDEEPLVESVPVELLVESVPVEPLVDSVPVELLVESVPVEPLVESVQVELLVDSVHEEEPLVDSVQDFSNSSFSSRVKLSSYSRFFINI